MTTLAQSSSARHANGATFALLLALLTAFRIAALAFNGTDLFFDEAQYWAWSQDLAFGYFSKPPLIAGLIGLASGLCGDSEFCVRLPSVLVHAGTAIVLLFLARRLYDARVAFWTGLVFATLPGVSLSAGIISTDVPLLFFFALALYAFVVFLDKRSWGAALLLAVALGLGLNAKYAMIYFVLGIVVFAVVTPGRRRLLADPRLYLALLVGIAFLIPNVLWNLQNGFATVEHTAANAKWTGALLHPGKGLEFLGSQFGVFGPVLFVAYLALLWRSFRHWRGTSEADRLLIAFSLPILLLITVQAFLSRAHANWAATAYVAATVWVTAALVRDFAGRWLKLSFVLHLLVIIVIAAGTTLAGRVAPPVGKDPFARTLGWSDLAGVVRKAVNEARAKGTPYAAIVTDTRSLSAELLYYLRDEAMPIRAWRFPGPPRDHFEMSRPFTAADASGPVLYVTLREESDAVTGAFATVTPLGEKTVPAGPKESRVLRLFSLSGLKAE